MDDIIIVISENYYVFIFLGPTAKKLDARKGDFIYGLTSFLMSKDNFLPTAFQIQEVIKFFCTCVK